MNRLIFFIPIFLFASEILTQDVSAPIYHAPILPELPKRSFSYIGLGCTALVPLMLESKTTTYYGVPGVEIGHHTKTRKATIQDKLSLVMPELSWGRRSVSSRHVFDQVVGVVAQSEIQALYVQGSYLFYPTQSKGLYFGAGMTCGLCHINDFAFYGPFLNLPLTLGYQFPSKSSYQFIQIQGTLLETGTISYGIGF